MMLLEVPLLHPSSGTDLQATAYNPYPTSLLSKAGKLGRLVLNGVGAVLRFILSIPSRLKGFAALTPEQRRETYKGWWLTIKKEAHHYWVFLPPPSLLLPTSLLIVAG